MKTLVRFYQSFDKQRNKFIILCLLVGIIGGLLSIAFHLSIYTMFSAIWKFGGSFGEENRWWIMSIMPALGGLIVGLSISTFAKGSAEGSGIPQTKACYYNNDGIFKFKDIVYRFILGAIFCGFGNSAGREGPTVHICSSLASVIAQKMKFAKSRIKDAIPIGMASGISASFNAPLSSISFVFEELLSAGNGKVRHFGGIIMAVVLSAALSRLIIGENPVVNIPNIDYHTGIWMLFVLPIAICSGLIGNLFLENLLKLRGRIKRQKKIPYWASATLGGLIVGLIATFAYYKTGYNAVFSVGYSALIPAFSGEMLWDSMLVICLFKFVATIINYAMGGSGGLFSPTLVIGGMLGGLIGALFYAGFDMDKNIIGAGVLLGMGACFASIIRCPITSVIIIFELTLNYSLILPLMIGNFISYYIASFKNPVGLYDALLLQDGIVLNGKMDKPSDTEISDIK